MESDDRSLTNPLLRIVPPPAVGKGEFSQLRARLHAKKHPGAVKDSLVAPYQVD